MKIRGKRNDMAIGVYYRPPNQADEIDEVFANQLAKICRKQPL